MVRGNVPLESEGKGRHIRHCYQSKLCTDHKDRSAPKHDFAVSADEKMKQWDHDFSHEISVAAPVVNIQVFRLKDPGTG